jgi:hypothetical protein
MRDIKVRYKQTALGFAWGHHSTGYDDASVFDFLWWACENAVGWTSLSDLCLCSATAMDFFQMPSPTRQIRWSDRPTS